MDSNVSDLFELVLLVELVVVSIDGTTEGESSLIIGVGESV